MAVDFHDEAPSGLLAGGPGFHYVPFGSWHDLPDRYDAIFLRHVLEHHPDPLRLLAGLCRKLLPNGRLYIEVPNRHSVWASVFRRAYVGYYLPRHLMHFSAASLRKLVESSGLECLSVKLGHTPLIGRSLGYLTGTDMQNTGLVGLASYPLQVAVDVVAGASSTLRATAALRV